MEDTQGPPPLPKITPKKGQNSKLDFLNYSSFDIYYHFENIHGHA
jgi:hypothetical protein